MALGWKEGEQYTIAEHWAGGSEDAGLLLAMELAKVKPAVIVAAPASLMRVAVKAAPNVPVVQANGSSPVNSGYAKSLARPGGMVTGLSNITGSGDDSLVEKYIEMLSLAIPKLRRVGVLIDGGMRQPELYVKRFQAAAARFKIESRFAIAAGVEALEIAMTRLRDEKIDGLVIQANVFLFHERQRIVDRALKERWPTIGGAEDFAQAGALLSYGINRTENFRRAAYYVDKILKGAKPGDLPIEQLHRVELVLNNKTAKALGLRLPPELVVRADRVIE